MDAEEFRKQASGDLALSAFLQEVAQEVSETMEKPEQYYIPGTETLVSVAAYGLFRLVKDFFDHRRAINEVEIAQLQGKLIAALIADGFPPTQAKATAIALLKGVAKRTQDDPALKKALSLL